MPMYLNNLSLIQTCTEEVSNQLTAIDPSKASGPEELSGIRTPTPLPSSLMMPSVSIQYIPTGTV